MTDHDLIAVIMPDGSLQLEWTETAEKVNKHRALLQSKIHDSFAADTDDWLLLLGFSDPAVALSASLDFWRGLVGRFTAKLTKWPDLETLRQQVGIEITPAEIATHLEIAPMMTGSDYLDAGLLEDVWQGINAAFGRGLASYDGPVDDFIRSYSPNVHLIGRIFFHLVENKKGEQPFAFLATYATRLNREGQSKHLPLKYALQEYEGQREKLLELLSTAHMAARQSPVVADLLESGDIFHPLAWSARQAFLFLKDIPVFEDAGILCRIPDWWKGNRPSVTLDLSFGDTKPSHMGLDAVLNFNPHLFLDGHPISVAEARKLLAQSEGLALIKNKWVAVDPEKLRKTLEAYEKSRVLIDNDGLSLRDALRLELNPHKLLDSDTDRSDIGVSHGKWLASVLEKLQAPDLIRSVSPGKRFRADLRSYQQRGLNWLCFLHSLGFGACLADDMGLGKTVQVLAFLNRLKFRTGPAPKKRSASLLVIPASLIANWASETQRFAPGLNFLIAHSGANTTNDMEASYQGRLDDYDLVITTYALSHRYKWLQAHEWFYLILDEAQAIKNPGTRQTRALKEYRAQNRMVLTGTPIENRLSDLWSLFDFVNPGLLGSAAEFKRFARKLNKDHSGYGRLRRLISPYVLRRLKSDKRIIADLPDKVEMKTYATLSKKQVVLYEQTVSEIKTTLAQKDGMERKGLILSALMKFKQLCNHPDQYLGTGGYAEKESGKFARLREICETIYAKRERVLVFTQFKEITAPLCEFLESVFQRKGLIIHGSVPVAQRKKIIDEFQQSGYVPFMVLSLKAGGVGLNLTAANHVVHFDRWWNPAVENQATDRAFRIGQHKNVVVHKFVTRGTVEEKIDKMLEEKTKLADDVIARTGEALITEMDNDQLVKLFSLSL